MQKGSWAPARKTIRQPTQMTQIENSRHKQERVFEKYDTEIGNIAMRHTPPAVMGLQ